MAMTLKNTRRVMMVLDFDESKVKRDKDGKFSSTGGGGSSKKSESGSGRKSSSSKFDLPYERDQKTGWTKGKTEINGQKMKWMIKCFDEPSDIYGMEGGERISKLWISQNGKEVANYDRGWDVKPTSKEATELLDRIATIFG